MRLNRFNVKRALGRETFSTRLGHDTARGDEVMAEVAQEIKDLGDKIVGLTLKQAVDLATYLKEAHGIEPAAGGAVMMAAPGGPGAAAAAPAEEKTTFDVVLKSGGDKKIQVIKVVRAA